MPEPPPAPADLNVRLVRYFTAVADHHHHFGRATQALRVAL
jgi:hypothetical protein